MCFFRKKKKKLKEEALKKEAEVKQEPVDEVDDTEVIEEENKTIVLGTKVYHVNKRASDNQWTVKFAKGSKVIKLFKTKAEAMEYANELADKQGGVVLFHASKGKHKGKIIKQGWDAYKGKDEASTVPLDDDDDD